MARHLQIQWDLNDTFQVALAEAIKSLPTGMRRVLVVKAMRKILGNSRDPRVLYQRMHDYLYDVSADDKLEDKQKRHDEESKPLGKPKSEPLSSPPKSEPISKPLESEPLSHTDWQRRADAMRAATERSRALREDLIIPADDSEVASPMVDSLEITA